MQLVLFALAHRVLRLVPGPPPTVPHKRRKVALALVPDGMARLQRGELKHALSRLPISHTGLLPTTATAEAADMHEAALQRVAEAKRAKEDVVREEAEAIRDYLLLPGAEVSLLYR